ncbi:hypothetical protein PSU4_38510 [Pseudonocardia sulfidoxydans NBRC 16205]|uniref:Transmembrane protein n=1 Tax=Pseudonocardia sulfidoxydans NBRC 16205 TaxID=1223511 RepID=A0A511DKD7_9PSEU|nr:hypothetical protein [Pseudonocardia sulfidoxydans]GEL24897.1 hypothetical protein PSU4_38510 [Pseudonocardia sulfidoxydans NBRC 16205]
MRALRAVSAVLLMVLGTLLLVVALVLCVTLVLLPLGVPLGFLAVKLWKYAVTLLLPRKADVRRGLRKGFRVKEIGDAASDVTRRSRRLRKKVRHLATV